MGGIAGAGLGYGLGSGLNDTGGGTGTGGNMSGSTNQYYQPTSLQKTISSDLLNQYNQPNPYTTGAGADLGRQLSDMSRSGGGIGSLANDLSSQYNTANIPIIAGTLGGT